MKTTHFFIGQLVDGQYSRNLLDLADKWLNELQSGSIDDSSLMNDLEFVTPDCLNIRQHIWFDMVNESVCSRSQLLLIVNGTAGTSKMFSIAAIFHSLPAVSVIRCAFSAKAAF